MTEDISRLKQKKSNTKNILSGNDEIDHYDENRIDKRKFNRGTSKRRSYR